MIEHISNPSSAFRYWAFISYSHRDERWARWLHESLERYRLPRGLVGRPTASGAVPKRLYPVFRDRSELPSSSDLPDSITTALSQSRNLIVICSPHAVASHWVGEEAMTFKRLGRSSRIFSLIVEGEPFASDHPELGIPEAFPTAVRFRLGEDGELTQERVELLAADVRAGKDSKRNGKLKLIAGLLDLRLGELVEREKRRRILRTFQWVGAAAAVGAAIAAIWLQGQGRISTEQQRADREAQVASVRTLAEQAQVLMDRDPAQLSKSLLMGVDALERGIALGVEAETAYTVIRNGLALLPQASDARIPTEAAFRTAVFSNDGRRLATIEEDTVQLWDVEAGTREASLSPSENVLGLAFSANDQRLLTVVKGAVQSWDLASHELAGKQSIPEVDYPIGFGADGALLAVGAGPDVTVWDVRSGQVLRRFVATEPVTTLAISPDGRYLMAGIASQNMTGPGNPGAQLWDMRTGREIAAYKDETFVEGISFSADSRLVARGSGATISVSRTDNGSEVLTLKHRAAGDVGQRTTSLAFAKSSPWLAAGNGSIVQVWDVTDGRELARMPVAGTALAFHPGTGGLLTGDGRVWSMNAKSQRDFVMSGRAVIVDMKLAGDFLVAGSQQGGAEVWNVTTGDLAGRIPEGSHTTIQALSHDGHYAATMSGVTLGSTWSARLWRTDRADPVTELSPGGQITTVVMSSDSQLIATGDRDRITLYAVESGDRLAATQIDQDIRELIFVDRLHLVIRGNTGVVWWWQPEFDPVRVDMEEQHATTVAATPDGRNFAIATDGGTLLLVDGTNGLIVARKPFAASASQIRFSPDGQLAAAVSEPRLEIWELTSGQRIAEVQPVPEAGEDEENGSTIADIALSSDGQWVAVASLQRPQWQYSVAIWSTDSARRLATWIEGATQVALSPDGRFIAAAAGTSRITAGLWQPGQLIEAACKRIDVDVIAAARSEGWIRAACGEKSALAAYRRTSANE
jgi:WD40 repeat protein